MPEPLRLVTVELGDTPPTLLGTVALEDGTLTGDTVKTRDLIEMLRRRTKLPDPAIFAHLETEGWSNGQLMIQQ